MKAGTPSFPEAAQELARRVEQAVGDSVGGEGRVAVAFSGGLDSSILALCASRRAEVVACAGYVPGAPDGAKARRRAEELGVEFVATELTPKFLAEELALLELPFRPSLMDRSLWCLFWAVSRSARDSGARVMLLGQLSDELFGGYAKYAGALRTGGAPSASAMMEADVSEYSSKGRVRDVAACGRWVAPKFPFEAPPVVDYAKSLPLEFKIRDDERKAVLREAALALGLPAALARTPKKAAQYSSGVQKALARTLLTP